MTDVLTLVINGQSYGGWLEIQTYRALDRMASEFRLRVTERWPGFTTPWQIQMFNACAVKIGADTVLTGYVDSYEPTIAGEEHTVTIIGRGKTCDLIDCMPDVPSGQFVGYTLPAIAQALAGLFGIRVVVNVPAGEPLTDTMMDRCETCFEFLERLARLSQVLLTDDEMGNLVLTRTGSARAHDSLIHGQNVLRARGQLNGARRYSRYVVKAQHAMSKTSAVQTGQEAVATDPGVPRFRQHVQFAESQLTAQQMQERVRWQAKYAAGRSCKALITVQGWRQTNGALWRLNQLVSVTVPPLELDQDMLIAGVRFTVGEQGQETELTVGPPEAYTPDPGEVKLRKHKGSRGKGGKGGEFNWSGAGGIQ